MAFYVSPISILITFANTYTCFVQSQFCFGYQYEELDRIGIVLFNNFPDSLNCR